MDDDELLAAIVADDAAWHAELVDELPALGGLLDDAALAQTVLDLDAPVREALARLHDDDVAWLEALNVGPDWDAGLAPEKK